MPIGQRTPRQNAKDASASSQRRHMNQRRQDLSSKIRKSRRSHTVQLKRRVRATPSSSDATVKDVSHDRTFMTTSTSNTFNFGATGTSSNGNGNVIAETPVEVTNFLNSPIETTLCNLQLCIASSSSFPTKLTHDNHQNNDMHNDNNVSVQFLTTIANLLLSSSSTMQMKLDTARILTNLAAMELPAQTASNNNDEDTYSYYGKTPESWCDIMLKPQTNTLQSLLQILSSFSQTQQQSPQYSQYSQIASQCCWAIGNIAGDSQSARTITIRKHHAILPLTTTLRHAVYRTGRSDGNRVEAEGWTTMARNAAWALSNLARGGETSSIPFLDFSTSARQDGGGSLSARDFILILSVPFASASTDDNVMKNSNGGDGEVVTWKDVTIETFWLLAFLTAREDESVDVLFSRSSGATTDATSSVGVGGASSCGTEMFQMLLSHFHLATQTLLSPHNSNDNRRCRVEDRELAVRMIIPIIRTIGNVATASGGRYVSTLLQQYNIHPTTQAITPGAGGDNPDTASSSLLCRTLAQWIEQSQCSYDGTSLSVNHCTTIATEVSWVIGTLLCDAGYANHPSTTVACPILIPTLCRALVERDRGVKLELKREILSALWNALSEPPSSPSNAATTPQDETITIRDEILVKLYQTNGCVEALIEILSSYDVDAICPALKIIDAMHRRLSGRQSSSWNGSNDFRTVFEEADCANALEGVCDRASASASYGNGQQWDSSSAGGGMDFCAEMAANLIDDYYAEEALVTDGNGEGCLGMDVGDVSTGGRFAFGVPSSFGTMPPFQFGNGDAGRSQKIQQASEANANTGAERGRGRGVNTTPAWMNKT